MPAASRLLALRALDPASGRPDLVRAARLTDQAAEGGDAAAMFFASENEGGAGLVAAGIAASAIAAPKKPGVQRQTPCVSTTVKQVVPARRRLGRAELKPFADRDDGRPERS